MAICYGGSGTQIYAQRHIIYMRLMLRSEEGEKQKRKLESFTEPGVQVSAS